MINYAVRHFLAVKMRSVPACHFTLRASHFVYLVASRSTLYGSRLLCASAHDE